MKMEHPVNSDEGGRVLDVAVSVGDLVEAGQLLLSIDTTVAAGRDADPATILPRDERRDLADVVARHRLGLDAARPDAVRARHERGHRTTRENIEALIDPGSLVEYGPLAIAAQRRRRDVEELIERTPADGLVGGIATIDAEQFGAADARCVVASYDYTVLAGTQGMTNHAKKDRLFDIAERLELPVIFFTEGGGGRPGDVDQSGVSWLDCLAFALFGRLAGRTPLIGVNDGYCFAGNAALLGTCDIVIASTRSNIGMGGPAMIEGGGLGTFMPEEVGPADVHRTNGVVDVLVNDDVEATAIARRIVGYALGPSDVWTAPAAEASRLAVPEDRKRVYDIHRAIDGIVDHDSFIELRPHYQPGIVIGLARVEGHPLLVIANNPVHLSGAIDHGGALKAADAMRLAESWGLPVLFVCDTPGFMVGPDSDAAGLPRSAGELFRLGANLTVPFGTVITRKCYGLGAQAMMGGGLRQPLFSVAWPTGEFGPMGLEGAVHLGFRRELDGAATLEERDRMFDELVDKMYEHGRALNVATHFEIDDVIDPADTRRWVTTLLFG